MSKKEDIENKTENKPEENGTKEQPKIEMTADDIKAKSVLGRFLTFVSDKFLKPSVITVFVTALLGPVAIQWVNDSLENKKLQEKVIQTVLNYTNEADFSKPESIEKIGIIAQMVNENKDVFQLQFEETTKAINLLNKATGNVGLKALNKELENTLDEIKSIEQELVSDSLMLADLREDKAKKEKRLRNRDKPETEKAIAELDLEIKKYEIIRDRHQENLRKLKEKKNRLEADIKAANKDLGKLLEDNREIQQMLAQEKDSLKVNLKQAFEDNIKLKAKIEKLEKELRQYRDSLALQEDVE